MDRNIGCGACGGSPVFLRGRVRSRCPERGVGRAAGPGLGAGALRLGVEIVAPHHRGQRGAAGEMREEGVHACQTTAHEFLSCQQVCGQRVFIVRVRVLFFWLLIAQHSETDN